MEVPKAASNDVMHPNYEVTLGTKTFDGTQAPELINIKVCRNVGLPTDLAEICLIGSRGYPFKKGDTAEVKLGYDDHLFKTFTGKVENISQDINRIRVTALGAGVKLLRLRVNKVFLSQNAGLIVKNIAAEAGVKVKTASDGISFPVYTIDDSMNGYEHILKLAEQCNFDAYFTENEELIFKEWGNAKNNPLKFGREIIRLEAFDYSPLYGSAKVYGESPSSIKGSDTYHWLTKKEVKGEAGNGIVLLVQDPSIRDQKTAQIVAKAKNEKLKYTFGLIVETIGKPVIGIGDNVIIEGAPYSNLDGTVEVRSVEHYLSKDRGFISVITCRRKV